jgi:ADP-heptose:LPS heptosyltransferase
MDLKVLIVRFSSIGDIVLTSPLLRCLRAQTNWELHFLTKASFRGILAGNPHIDRLLTIDRSVGELKGELKSAGYDLVIDLHKNLRTLHLRTILPTTKFRSYRKDNWDKWKMVHLKSKRIRKRHIADRYFGPVKTYGIHKDGHGLEYYLQDKDWVDLERAGIRGAFVSMVIGAAHFTKRYPADKVAGVCKQFGLPIVLIGGAEERRAAQVIMDEAGPHVISYCGDLTIGQSAFVIRKSAAVITNDTGFMHIAAAFQIPVVSLWGNTVPEFGLWPYYGQKNQDLNMTMEVNELSCRPCHKIGRDSCPRGHFRCMRDIDPAIVASAAWKMLELSDF